MTDYHLKHLHEFLTVFDAANLGEGDAIAGTNTLATMACSLANIARPGSGLHAKDEGTISVGANFLVSGSHSPALVSEKILGVLAKQQNNLNSYVYREAHHRLECAQRNDPNPSSPPPIEPDFREAMIAQLQKPCSVESMDSAANWGTLVEAPARPGIQDLLERPKVYISGCRAADLEKQLDRSHMGCPFIHMGVDRPGGFDQFRDLCPAIMDGLTTTGPLFDTVQGTVALTDPSGILGDSLRSDKRSHDWTKRLLWLVDGGVGPEAPDRPHQGSPIALEHIDRRFKSALSMAWGERLDNRSTGPKLLLCNSTKFQNRWVAFLRKHEPECPGILGAARPLLATLVFGLEQIINAEGAPEDFKWSINHSEALAQFLVLRMVNARAAILLSAENSRRLEYLEGILHRLAEGPHSLRRLSRRFHKLSQGECLELLLDHEAAGRAFCIDAEWRLTETTAARFRPLALEV